MIIFRGIAIILILVAGPVAAQDVKSSSDLFLRCADYDNQRNDLTRQMEAATANANYLNDKSDRLESQIEDHERELNRLDDILKIMRNSDNVWDKRDREYNRYTRTLSEYDDFWDEYSRQSANFQSLIDRGKRLTTILDTDCLGTWSTGTLAKFCGTGEPRFQMFCSRFKSYSDE